MLTFLFFILLLSIFGHLLIVGIKAAWGLGKIIVNIVGIPLLLILLVFSGLLKIAFPLLLVIGVVALISEKK